MKRTALHYASYGGNVDLVKRLIGEGAEVFITDKDGRTALDLAEGKEELQCLCTYEVLKRGYGNNVNKTLPGENSWTALYYASKAGNVDLVKRLIGEGAEVNIADWDGRTPLHLASLYEFEDVFRCLLDCKVEINAKDRRGGFTPLHWAVLRNRESLVKLLLGFGADPNITDNLNGRTPLGEATWWNRKDIFSVLYPLTQRRTEEDERYYHQI